MSAIRFWSLPSVVPGHNVDDMTELKGKRALVTGGSRGLGAAIITQLLDAGAEVLGAARSATSTVPAGAAFVEADVRTRAGAEALVQAADRELGGVDILVNNAGAARLHIGGTPSIPDSEWQDALDINFLSSVRLDSLVLPQMKERGNGSIIHISSAVIYAPNGALLHYTAAKAALESYSRGLALEVAPFGIRVNTVLPGNVASPGADLIREQLQDAGISLDAVASTVPLGRGGEPDDVANMVSFLLSDKASWITGRRFTVDGGEFPRD
jgi:NAD(P)-dependent dehydrogenase (short-subunit alcohol dehydrogenase family)